ncbi:hypothetical protein GCM10011309_13270 [Litorimonas cladophorae]|uniref:Lipoprotein n=1 Tax=Litorimonas cladophorae TaxID=1220491 RepID=A0A918NDF3_9PROT|nr:hypothetical protein [Litorimonas cladophorae]GGX64448.1 hypothetical protein GCM10011309_13270 [Litorimonas cladophorae]
MSMKTTLIGAAALSFLALAGCRSTQEVLEIGEAGEANPGPCPRAFALYDVSRIVEIGGDGAERFDNVGFTGEIDKVRSFCRYYADRPIVGDLTIDFSLGRGPAADGDTKTYAYFVAVTRKNIEVIEKAYFPLTVTFAPGQDRMRVTETIDEITIPRANDTTSGENFEIIVGFDVTEEQRAFNADGKRFRVSAGQR